MTPPSHDRQPATAPQPYHWARPPYPQLKLNPEYSGAPSATSRGVANLPEADLVPAGGGGTFHNPGDAPPGTTVSNNGGPTLSYAQVAYLFWGTAWNSPSLNPGVANIFLALRNLDDRFNDPPTNYFSGLTQYGVADVESPLFGGFQTVMEPAVIPSNPPNNPFSLSDVENEVTSFINDPLFVTYPERFGGFPPGSDGALNFIVVFMPPGYSTAGPFGEHSFITDQYGNQWAMAYISYGTLSQMTFVFTHELIEAMTDVAGTAWQVNPRNSTSWNEICDVCASSGVVNGTVVTSYFSQSAGACYIPNPPPPPPPALPSGDFQIDSVAQSTSEAGNLYITHVSGPGNAHTNGRWIITESVAIDLINSGNTTFYTDVDGRRAKVIEQSWYLTTVADGFTPNNLDSLPRNFRVIRHGGDQGT